MSPEEFNKWRQKNDLPKLFQFFKENLPYFEEWLSEYKISDNDFCFAPHTSQWFLGSNELTFTEYKEDKETKHVICANFESKFEFLSKHKDISKKRNIYFTPYLLWGKNRTGTINFIQTDKVNISYSDTFRYGLWKGGPRSQAYLLNSFPVLKLGQIKLANGVLIAPRNLDFVDLDELVITGDHHGAYATEVTFSSCRNISIEHGGLHHVSFRYCVLDDFHCSNGRIQDFLFQCSSVNNFSCIQSTINGMTVKYSSFYSPLIDRTEIQRFSYTPDLRYKRYHAESDICRRLRNVFQNIGRRHESQHYYYLERCYERKALWSPYLELENRSKFPKRTYAGRLTNLFSQWKGKHFTTKETLGHLLSIIFFHIILWCSPKYVRKALGFKINYFGSLISYLVWGYGLKPSRALTFGMFIIVSYAVVYYFIGPTAGSQINSIYFSTVTFTTLGYGDILPNSGNLKLLCSSEALLGAVTLGLIIGAFSNKSAY